MNLRPNAYPIEHRLWKVSEDLLTQDPLVAEGLVTVIHFNDWANPRRRWCGSLVGFPDQLTVPSRSIEPFRRSVTCTREIPSSSSDRRLSSTRAGSPAKPA